MKDELVNLEVAKLAKQVGFNIPTWFFYTIHNTISEHIPEGFAGMNEELWQTNSAHKELANPYFLASAPTQSLLQRWIREKHNIQINIFAERNKKRNKVTFCNYIISLEENMAGLHYVMSGFDTHEEALEAGLLEALKLIKT